APWPWQIGLLRRLPVARVPVPLEEVLREPKDVAQVIDELEHPERSPDLVPAERRRRDLLLEVPGQVERVGAVEHAEVVGLAPHDLLAAAADREWEAAELDVHPQLAQLVLELERVERLVAEAVQAEVVDREALERRRLAGGVRDADLRRLVEVVAAVDHLPRAIPR